MARVGWDNVNKGSGVIISGLQATVPSSKNTVRANLGRSSGKWYWEIECIAGASFQIGISSDISGVGQTNNEKGVVYYAYAGRISSDGKYHRYDYGKSYTVGDTISVLLDFNTGNIEFWKNGVSQGVAVLDDLRNLGTVYPAVTESGSQSQVVIANFGETPFKYQMPVTYSSYDGNQYGAYHKFLIQSSDGEVQTYQMADSDLNIIPTMTSNTSPSGVANASNIYTSSYQAWKAFNKVYNDVTDGWRTDNTHSTGWISYEFKEPKVIGKYTIISLADTSQASAPRDWTFEGSNDGTNWVVLDTQSNQINWEPKEKREFTFSNSSKYKIYRLNVSANNGSTNLQIMEIEMMETYKNVYSLGVKNPTDEDFRSKGMEKGQIIDLKGICTNKTFIESEATPIGAGKVFKQKIDTFKTPIKNASIVSDSSNDTPIYVRRALILNNGMYKKYEDGWRDLGTAISDQLFLTDGMDDVSVITESAWLDIQGDVEICYYTDEPRTEVQFSIETKPFTLADEFFGQEIKVIEYTDSPNQEESSITLNTEPFTLYDELSDDAEILYYTDDPSKNSAELELIANYSPLDEIDADYDVVTWTDEVDANRTLSIEALPIGQLVLGKDDIKFLGDFQSFVVEKISSATGKIRFVFSLDHGVSWLTYYQGAWHNIDINNRDALVREGMTVDRVNNLKKDEWLKMLNDSTRIGYFIEESPSVQNDAKVKFVKHIDKAAINDVKVSDLAFYILNTTATINVTFAGNKISGILDDADKGKVQYRVLLNDKFYYPSDGSFTPIAPSPLQISLNISEKDILFGKQNTLKIEFQDAWEKTDFWQTAFVGTYSGLMFMDENHEYYSDSFGGVLKHLDFGIIIAGQTTLQQKVIVKNQLGKVVQNLLLEPQNNLLPSGVKLELSYDSSPFIAEDFLLFNKLIQPDEELEFYIRIATSITAPPAPNGQFEIRAKVDDV